MRHWFGGGVPDFVTAPGQQVERNDGGVGYVSVLSPGVPLWLYDAGTGERVTDLLGSFSEPVDEIVSGPYGDLPRFRGPDGTLLLLIGPSTEDGAPGGEDPPEDESPRFLLTTTDLPDLLTSAERRLVDLESQAGGGEAVATAHPLMWHVDGEVTAQRSHGVYCNLEGREQGVSALRARLSGVDPDTVVTVRALSVDPDTGTASVLGSVDLSATRTSHQVWLDEALSNGAELTTEVELTGQGSAEHLTVQVMVR